MKKYIMDGQKIINIILAVLMLVMLILQFIPFWSMGSQEISIGEYAWLPTEHEDFTTYFQQAIGNSNFHAGYVAYINVIVLLACTMGIIFCFKNADDVWPSIFPAACGIAVIYGHFARPVFHMGAMWKFHLVLAIGMIALTGLSLIFWIKKARS